MIDGLFMAFIALVVFALGMLAGATIDNPTMKDVVTLITSVAYSFMSKI